MVAQNQFLPFAIGVGAQRLTPAQYAAMPARAQGFQNGIADPAQCNTIWAQASFVAAMIGQFTADYSGQDALDNGVVRDLEDRFVAALRVALGADVLLRAADTSNNPNRIVVSVPSVAEYTEDLIFLVRVKNNNTGETTFKVNDLEARAVIHVDGTALDANAVVANGYYLLKVDASGKIQALNAATAAQLPPQGSQVHYGVDTSDTVNAVVATLTPEIFSYAPPLLALVRINFSNTDAVTVDLGFGPKGLVRPNGDALQHGDIQVGGFAMLAYDGTSFQLLNPLSDHAGGGGTGPTSGNEIDDPLADYWLTVDTASQTAPPANPVVGTTYLIPQGATGSWAPLVGQIAQASAAGGFAYRTYRNGTVLGVKDATGRAAILRRLSTAPGGWRSVFATDAEAMAGTAQGVMTDPAAVAAIIEAARPPALFFSML